MDRASLELLRAQWQRAATDLGIEFVSPYILEVSQLERYEFACLLPQFGAARGMLLRTAHDKAAIAAAVANGFGISQMGPETKLEYDISSYIECLCDWGWAVEHLPPPEWYEAAMRSNTSLERTRGR
jgi:hypothetical protein